jgi:hypothetical protein
MGIEDGWRRMNGFSWILDGYQVGWWFDIYVTYENPWKKHTILRLRDLLWLECCWTSWDDVGWLLYYIVVLEIDLVEI